LRIDKDIGDPPSRPSVYVRLVFRGLNGETIKCAAHGWLGSAAMEGDRRDVSSEKPIPMWLGIGVMGLILLVGLGLIVKYVYRRPSQRNAIHVVTPAPGQPRVARSGGSVPGTGPAIDVGAIAREAELSDGIHPLGGNGGTLVKAGNAYLKVFGRREDGDQAISLGFFTVSDEQWVHGYLSNGVRRALGDEEYAKELGVTSDQRKGLERLPAEPPPRWPAVVRERLVGLYKEWESAGEDEKSGVGNQLIDALGAAAKTKHDADEVAMRERVMRIRSILMPAQAQQMNPFPKWNLPTSRATTRP
jgi:hypothetical protein